MKKAVVISLALVLSGCGFSSRNNETIGQVKKVSNETPIVCKNFNAADISLGVMIKGVGSMSSQDQWFYVADQSLVKTLQEANKQGSIVRIKYDVKRFTLCVPELFMTNVEILETK